MMLRPKECRFVIFALLLCCLSGCSPSELNRSRVEGLIGKDDAFKPDVITLDFRIGSGILDVGPVERNMEKAGLIEISLQKCRPYNIGYTPGRGYDCGEIAFTEKGEKAAKNWNGTPWDNEKGMDYVIPVASRVVREVTGIRQNPALGTIAEFRWGCEPNDLARKDQLDVTPPVFMSSGVRCPNNNEAGKAEAFFKHDADGWHLEQIRW